MKISSVPAAYRNLRRFREMAKVLRRYGLADWLSRMPRPLGRRVPMRLRSKAPDGTPLESLSRAHRVRLALTELGPTFIKLGQLLASRPDLVGPEMSDEFKRLRADVSPEPIDSIRRTLADELGSDFDHHFKSIEVEPLACASIGQVHRGKLPNGQSVVLKIQRSEIDRVVREDIAILTGLAPWAAKIDTLAAWAPVEMVEQLAPIIRRELDFGSERRNLVHFAERLGEAGLSVRVPQPIEELCTAKVLVMEELDGTPLSQWSAEHADASERAKLGELIASVYLKMVFEDSEFHADPHSGNLMVSPKGELGILDFGMVGRIDQNLRESLEDMLVAVVEADEKRLTRIIRRIGRAPARLDETKLNSDVVEYIARYSRQQLGSFDLTGALNDLSGILHRHGIRLPYQSALLLKMLVSLEGTLKELDVPFDSLSVVRDAVRQSMWKRLSPVRRARKIKRVYLEAERFLEAAPDEALMFVDQLRRGEFSMQFKLRRLGPTVNRVVLGLMASSVFLGASILMATGVPPRFWPDQPEHPLHGTSVIGLLAMMASMAVMMWLVLAIHRSGDLTRDSADEPDSA